MFRTRSNHQRDQLRFAYPRWVGCLPVLRLLGDAAGEAVDLVVDRSEHDRFTIRSAPCPGLRLVKAGCRFWCSPVNTRDWPRGNVDGLVENDITDRLLAYQSTRHRTVDGPIVQCDTGFQRFRNGIIKLSRPYELNHNRKGDGPNRTVGATRQHARIVVGNRATNDRR